MADEVKVALASALTYAGGVLTVHGVIGGLDAAGVANPTIDTVRAWVEKERANGLVWSALQGAFFTYVGAFIATRLLDAALGDVAKASQLLRLA